MNREYIWEQTQQKLQDADAAISVAEYHGHLIGRHVGGHEVAGSLVVPLVAELTGASREQVQGEREDWQELVGHYFEDFDSAHFGFQPLLPQDSLPLAERLEGLAMWSTGFLNGIGCALNQVQAGDLLEKDETIADLVEISQLDSDAEETDENEALYSELVEFVRLAVLDLHENLKQMFSEQPDESEQVH